MTNCWEPQAEGAGAAVRTPGGDEAGRLSEPWMGTAQAAASNVGACCSVKPKS